METRFSLSSAAMPPVSGGISGAGAVSAYDLALETEASPLSLQAHLERQLRLSVREKSEYFLGVMLIDRLDENGWLEVSSEDMAQLAKENGCTLAQFESVLEILQTLEPVGVFARSLSECLSLQLRDAGALDEPMRILLDNLELLAQGELHALAEACSVSTERIIEMTQRIKRLNPRPASGFGSRDTIATAPDILLSRTSADEWRVELNPQTLPSVLVNESLYRRVRASAKNEETRNYITEKWQSANWLLRALHQRSETILRTASEIVRLQEGFFRFGVSHLKPMVLREIADALSLHESTVSRVCASKTMATPRGVFALKYFFSSGVRNALGVHSVSARSVCFRIRELVASEQPEAILSDDKLAQILKNEGVHLARRTVAKYRESMDIPGSLERRRRKKPQNIPQTA